MLRLAMQVAPMGRALLLLLILAPPPLRGSGQQEGLPPTPGRQQQTEDDDVAAPRYHSVASPALQQFFRARYPAPKLTASDGRLLLAQPVVAGEELFAVPRARILTASTVRELSDFLDAGVDVVSPPPPPRSLWLPLWLSYERHRPDSPHAPYLAALPTAFHLPFLWSPAERAGLRSSWLGAAVEEDVRVVEQSFVQHLQPLCAAAPEHWPREACTRSTWRWAWAVVWSRALGIPSRERGGDDDGTGNENGLIPLLDLANHDSHSSVTGRWVASRGEFVVVAGEPLAAGTELTLNYNDWGSAEMLQHYGFVHASQGQRQPLDDTIDLEAVVLLRPASSTACSCKLA